MATLTLFAVFVYFGVAISLTKSLYWWSSTLIITVCILGLWYSMDGCSVFQSVFEEDVVQQEFVGSSSKAEFKTTNNAGPQATTYFTDIWPILTAKTSDQMNTNLTSGPKLFNPKVTGKWKKGKINMKFKDFQRFRTKKATFVKMKKQPQNSHKRKYTRSSRQSKSLKTVRKKKRRNRS